MEEMIYSTGAAEAATGAAESVTGNVGGNITGNVVGSIGSVGNNGITSGSFASNAITSDALATSAGTEIAAAVLGDTSSYGEGSKGAAIDNASATANDIDGRIPAALGHELLPRHVEPQPARAAQLLAHLVRVRGWVWLGLGLGLGLG